MTASTRLRPQHGQSAAVQGPGAEKPRVLLARKAKAGRRAKPAVPALPASPEGTGWGVYMLRCVDGTLYTGCTNHCDRRLGVHGKGRVKYTRGRLPVALVYWEASADKSSALRREAALKRLSRRAKLALCGYAKLC